MIVVALLIALLLANCGGGAHASAAASPAQSAGGGRTIGIPPAWTPFTNNPLNYEMGDNPPLDRNSANEVRTFWSMGGGTLGSLGVAMTLPSKVDYGVPIYWSQPGDPVFTIQCTMYGGKCPASGRQVRIPAGAQPEGGDDGHMVIVDAANDRVWEFWQAPAATSAGGTFSISWGGYYALSGPGNDPLGGGDATGIALAGGTIDLDDLDAGPLNHSIEIGVPCTGPVVQYPAHSIDVRCNPPNANAVPAGGFFWSDLTDAQVDALPGAPQYLRNYYKTLHHHGMVVMDTTGGGAFTGYQVESGIDRTSFGQQAPIVRFAAKYGLRKAAGDDRAFIPLDIPGLDMSQHLHVVAPCFATKSC